ncbi:MAG: AAA family ATPase, partial [Clostridia bacterium]
MYNRIMIIGSPGSGKSTLSFKLEKLLNIPAVHLDGLFWKSGWVEASREEFDTSLMAELEKPRWIIDGNYGRTIPLRLKYADAVIFLDCPTHVCLFRIIKRIITNYGKVRPDMGAGCPERFDFEFLRYVADFRKTQRAKLYGQLKNAEAAVFVVRNKMDLAETVRRL